jgi:GT2 family glycosyltransferase
VRPDELVVVDSGSVPDLATRLATALEGSGIALVYARSEPGTSLQRNRAIELATGDIFFFFDDDVELEPDYVERTLECFHLQADPPVGGVMGTQTNAPWAGRGREIVNGLFGLTHWAQGDAPRLYAAGGVRYCVRPSRVIEVPAVYGCCVAFRRACFDGERFAEFLPGYTLNEDVELSYRISRRWTILQTPFARVKHNVSPVSRVSLPNRTSRLVFAKYWFVRQHRPHDLRHLAAFAWSNAGLAALTMARGLRGEPGPVALAGGLVDGWRRSVAHYVNNTYDSK